MAAGSPSLPAWPTGSAATRARIPDFDPNRPLTPAVGVESASRASPATTPSMPCGQLRPEVVSLSSASSPTARANAAPLVRPPDVTASPARAQKCTVHTHTPSRPLEEKVSVVNPIIRAQSLTAGRRETLVRRETQRPTLNAHRSGLFPARARRRPARPYASFYQCEWWRDSGLGREMPSITLFSAARSRLGRSSVASHRRLSIHRYVSPLVCNAFDRCRRGRALVLELRSAGESPLRVYAEPGLCPRAHT